MARTDNKILALLACSATGDLGPWTLYTSKRRQIVFYDRAPALSPASLVQRVMRDRWRIAGHAWSELPPSTKEAYNTLATRTRSIATGYNIWIWYQTTRDARALESLALQAGVIIPIIPEAIDCTF